MGIQVAEPKSIRPVEQERILNINHSLMQKARNDAPKKGGSNRIGQETIEIKKVKPMNEPRN